MLTPMIATTHMLGNVFVTVDGDVADCESRILAWHRIPADDENPVRDLTAQGRYVDRIQRRDGEWRIAHRTVVFDRTRIELAGEEFPVGPDVIWGQRDQNDLSYRVLAHRMAPVGA
jgi:hypothetical protein